MIKVSEEDLHHHLKGRMAQRGITQEELEKVLNEGREATGRQLGAPWKSLCIRV